MNRLVMLCVGLSGLLPLTARAQLEEETLSRKLDLRRGGRAPKGPFDISTFKGRYQYELACFHRLLPLRATIARCVDLQRMASAEFHGRLDFDIEPSGRVKKFSTRFGQLQACLMPKALTLSFPPFGGRSGQHRFQVLVASPGVELGQRVKPKPIAVYPLESEAEQKAYRIAIGWVYSPWSMAVSRCAELSDQQFGFGYEMKITVDVSPEGRASSANLSLRGKLADRAIGDLAACVTPFVRAMEVPPHAGSDPFPYRFRSRTAGWGVR